MMYIINSNFVVFQMLSFFVDPLGTNRAPEIHERLRIQEAGAELGKDYVSSLQRYYYTR